MDNLLETILGAQNGGAVSQIARQFGLGESQVTDIIGQLAPTLGRGLQANTQASGGLDSLLDALQKGNHSRYVDDPSTLGRPEATDDGNSILGHILGSKEVSRELAGRAANNTGVDSGIIKKILPLIAGLVMGGLSKQTDQTGQPGQARQAQSGNQITDVLGSFLDADGDGSALDDLISMAGKFLGR